ncbi:MAG: hypothetical protein CSA65_03790 [Proteobacteria bacterium]|nr:MAG: hypothetical protein CSB49_04625 [Pseudomonadota bacterium]PIE18937.1 MAG: hypothetical protein CSA65_03790 [Pseudomonadota bacterium]
MAEQSSGNEDVSSWLLGGSAEPDQAEAAALELPRLGWAISPALQQLQTLLEGGRVAVGRLSGVALHRLANELGLHDSLELLELAEAEQVREVLDLQVWAADRVDIDELRDWVYALTLLGDDSAERHLRGLDVELLGYLLRTHCAIYLARDEDEPLPEEPIGSFYTTPDGWFAIDIVCETESELEQLTGLLDRIYALDPEWGRSLLQNLMWELSTELEEWSLRWRSGRLADLGFADPLEALAVYAPLTLDEIDPDEGSADRPPSADPEPVGEADPRSLVASGDDSFWSRALAQVDDDDERRRLSQAMMFLANRTLSADRVAPEQHELADESLRRLRGRLSIGLEQLTNGEVDRASHVLGRVALSRIARLGHGMTVAIGRPLLPLARQGGLGRGPRRLDLLEPALERRLNLLISPRPTLGETEPPRAFASRADLRLAGAWVDEARLSARLAPREIWPRELPDGLTLPSIFRSRVVARALGLPALDEPLPSASLQALRAHLAPVSHEAGFDETIAAAARAELEARVGDQSGVSVGDRDAAARLALRWFASLARDLAAIPVGDAIDPRFVAGLYLSS